jgi:hypothetical protein
MYDAQVHVEGEGVGCIISCLGPFFSGVRFEVQVIHISFLKHIQDSIAIISIYHY